MVKMNFETVMLIFLKIEYDAMDEIVSTYRNLVDVEGPKLKATYFDQIAPVEETVLQAELEAEMMKRKAELAAIAHNRHEKPDMDEIDKQVKAEFNEKLSELATSEVTEIEALENWKKDKEIVNRIDNAGNLPQLSESVCEYAINRINGFFISSEEEPLVNEIQRIQSISGNVESAIKSLGESFPFCAAEVLSDPDRIQEYIKSLEARKIRAEEDLKTYSEKLNKQLGEKEER